jgi:hypothetical protein
MNYIEWNNLIARKFFNEMMAGREVLLYVNEDTINQIGVETGADVEDFIQSVKVGPDWATKGAICNKALQSYRGWRIKNLEYPPYIAYLALFVLAATRGGDYDPKAYYPKLWPLLGEPGGSGTPLHFDHMAELWEDLQKWSTEDKHEELGRFAARIRGGKVHVGRPLSQTLLSDDERNYLPLIFSEAELDPTDTPSDAVIRRVLLSYGKDGLENRTLKLLDGTQGDSIEMVNALIDLVLNELVDWDGSVISYTISDLDHTPSQVGLRICLELNRVSGTIAPTLRLKTNRPFPDNGLEFEYAGQMVSCRETMPNWSTKLTNTNIRPQRPLDAATVNWSTGVRFEDKENKWRAHLKGTDVRLFLLGNREGLPGWVESQRLERNCEFMVACSDSRVADVQRWGTDCCEKFEEQLLQGLPSGWAIFEGRSAHESCEGVDVLTLSSLLRIRLQGGIKIGRGNRYLKFGPPLIVIEGGDGSERVTLNEDELKREDVSIARWHIPADAPVNCPLNIRVFKDGPDPLQKHVIRLEEPELPVSFKDVPSRDSSGQMLIGDVSMPCATGAVVAGVGPPPVLPPTLPTYLSRRITFLGSRPGEIVDWPDEDLPDEWQPVWAVDKSETDKWPVHFCGQPEDAGTIPNPNHAISNLHAVKRWREAIWVKRKKTEYQKTGYPALPKIRDIWNKYREVAKRV